MAAGAATLWGVNGTVAKVILGSGISSVRLLEIRTLGAAVGFVLVLLAVAPRRLVVTRQELPFLALFGILGLACVQLFYFLSIHRLAVGIALLIEYLGALLVALWARFVFHERVRRRIWLALALALGGLAMIVDIRGGGGLSTTGLAFAFTSAFTYTAYILLAERGVGDRDAVSLLAWGFGFASVFLAVIAPWWHFPLGRVADSVSLLGHLEAQSLPVWALMAWMIGLGTIVPFFLLVSALQHLPAMRVAIIAMLEPVVATVVAWAWLGESLTAIQLSGAVVVLAAIVLAQTAR
jgi:drug/metabolite transporter (DMT)-like permease